MESKTGFLDKLTLPLLITGGALVIFAAVFIFTVTPIAFSDEILPYPVLIGEKVLTQNLFFAFKIFFFHMPVAIVSMAALIFTAIYSIAFLKTRESRYDIRARLATEIALVFVLMTMVTGLAWTRQAWGVWWSWEPRLTTYFILMLMVFGYFILRTAVSDPERRATYSAVFGIIVFINVPICFAITRILPSIHPVIERDDSGFLPTMIIPLMVAAVGFCCLAFALYRLRLRSCEMEERIETLKLRLDDLKG